MHACSSGHARGEVGGPGWRATEELQRDCFVTASEKEQAAAQSLWLSLPLASINWQRSQPMGNKSSTVQQQERMARDLEDAEGSEDVVSKLTEVRSCISPAAQNWQLNIISHPASHTTAGPARRISRGVCGVR